MKKIILFTVVLTVITGTALFGYGAQEEDEIDRPIPSRWGMEYNEEDLLNLSGTLILEPGELPALQAAGKRYELMYPLFLDDDIEMTDGKSVTVEGFLVPGPRWEEEEDALFLKVTKAVIDGEEYELEPFAGRYGPRMSDPRSGMKSMGRNPRGQGLRDQPPAPRGRR